jgi:integrase/recombinase XerD
LRSCNESDGPALQARDTAIVLLLLDTGMRVSEVCGLKLGHVKLDGDPHVLVFGKGSKWREVGPLGKRTVRALRAYRNQWRERQHPKGEVDTFFLNRYGRAMAPITVERLLERLKARTGLEVRCNPHAWRHTWARSRAVEGTDVLVISRLMGHTSTATTSLYLGQFSSVDARKRVGSLVDSL